MDRRMTCEHLNKLADLPDKELWQSKDTLKCFDCGSTGPNLWICLQPECHHIGCSEVKNDHSTIHQKTFPLHCVHMNISTERIWCYSCEKEVHIQAAVAHHRSPDCLSVGGSSTASRLGFNHGTGLNVNLDNDSDDDNMDYTDDNKSQSRAGLVGLQNMGNTCYMNAALQALSHTQPLTDYFLDCSAAVAVLAADKKPGLSRSYQKLIKDLWNRKTRGYIVPNNILYGIRNVHPMFRGYHQHDTQEFLRCFMDQLHEELKEPDKQVWNVSAEDKLNSEADGDHQVTRGVHVRRRAASSGASDASYFARIRRKSPAPSALSEPTSDGYLRVHTQSETVSSDRGSNRHRRSASFAGTQHATYAALTSLYAGEPSLRSPGSESDLSCSSEAEERYETCSSGGASDAPDARHEQPRRKESVVSCSAGGSGDGCGGGGGLRYRSVISDVFDGKLLSSVQCLICDRVSTRVETFQDLSLPIPSREHLAVIRCQQPILNQHAPGQPGHDSWVGMWWLLSWLRSWFYGPVVSLQDCLAAFFSADELKGDNMYSCSRCNKLRNGVKMSGVVRLPEVLCVHLKRFRHELMFSAKVGARVAFPLHDLNMAPYTHKECTSKITRYELCAVISHTGTAGGGHYTCVARSGRGWYEFDDQCVTEISAASVAHVEAYVLFYRKVNPHMAVLRQKAAEILESATFEPNDMKFYISKQWINKFNTWAEPGPIDNSDFVCAHGGVRPDRAPHLHTMAERVPQHFWDFLYGNFGGGPACTHVHECAVCARAAERLRERRATELRAFYQLHAMFQAQEQPRAVYAISMHWFRQWQAFVRDKTPRPPPPVDNAGIVLKQEQDTGPVYVLKPGSDHAQLSEELWRFFTDIYGGGPEVLLRRALPRHNQYQPKYSDSDREDYCAKYTSETNLRHPVEILQKNQSLQHINARYAKTSSDEDTTKHRREPNGNYDSEDDKIDTEIKENGVDSSDHDTNDNVVYKPHKDSVEVTNLDGVSLKNKKSGRVRKMKRRTVK